MEREIQCEFKNVASLLNTPAADVEVTKPSLLEGADEVMIVK